MKVLLIEPDKTLGRVYKQALEGSGLGVDLASSAAEAIELADKSRPDVVVLELQLVVHSGVEFLYEFRSYPEWQSIPIILHTMFSKKSLELSAELGIVDFLYKPATKLDKLISKVKDFATASQ